MGTLCPLYAHTIFCPKSMHLTQKRSKITYWGSSWFLENLGGSFPQKKSQMEKKFSVLKNFVNLKNLAINSQNDAKKRETHFFCKKLDGSITFWAAKIEKNFFTKSGHFLLLLKKIKISATLDPLKAYF